MRKESKALAKVALGVSAPNRIVTASSQTTLLAVTQFVMRRVKEIEAKVAACDVAMSR